MGSEEEGREVDDLLAQLSDLRDWCFDDDRDSRALRLRLTVSARLCEQDFFRRGMLLNLTDQYDEQAERLLTKEVKLHPDNTEGWNQLGLCLWKKGSKELAHKCYLWSLSAGKSIHALQDLSMLQRQLLDSASPQDHILKSVDYALQAIELDDHNHKSW